MKLHKSLTPFLAFKREIMAFNFMKWTPGHHFLRMRATATNTSTSKKVGSEKDVKHPDM